MTMVQVREVIRRKHNNFRTLERIVTSPEFEECFAKQNDPKLVAAIENGDVEFVKNWLRKACPRDLSEYSIIELRKIASELAIQNYTLFTKEQLLVKITVKRNELEQIKNPARPMPYQQ